jgi:predicted site-specific integrase-resolvase
MRFCSHSRQKRIILSIVAAGSGGSQNDAMNVALYGRVSTKDKGQDTKNQLSQLRAFAATQG